MDKGRLEFLFYRYISNRCTDAEKSEFLELVHNSTHDEELRDLLDVLWREVPPKAMSENSVERILEDIVGERPPSVYVSRVFLWTRIAASLAFIALAGVAVYLHSSSTKNQYSLAASTPSPLADTRFIKLADGSTVVLNEGSKLDYPAEFSSSSREVRLTGEGYFDIAHDSNRPFIVHTGKLKTTVLGTAFNIKAYPGESDITVTVTRGKVKVSDDKKVLGILNPDQQITFNTSLERSEQKPVNSHAVAAWIEKDIFFDDISVAEALEQLEKRFQISVDLQNDKILGCRFTATFVRGEDVEQILRILCDFNKATLKVYSNSKYVIEGGECSV